MIFLENIQIWQLPTIYVMIGCLRGAYIFYHSKYTNEGRASVEIKRGMFGGGKNIPSEDQLIFMAAIAATIFWLPELIIMVFFKINSIGK